MKRFLVVALGAWALFPAVAADEPKSDDDEKVVCKRERELGSNMGGKKVCMTRAEWRRANETSERVLRNYDDRSRRGPLPNTPRGGG